MKKLLLVVACAGLASASVYAGDCSCGGKSKDGEKGKEGTKESLQVAR